MDLSFFLVFFSPLLMLLVALAIYWQAKLFRLNKPEFTYLVKVSINYGLICAGISLFLTIVWGDFYEKSTGYSAGNGPLGWIFSYGPISIVIGQLVALVQWWFTKSYSKSSKQTVAKTRLIVNSGVRGN